MIRNYHMSLTYEGVTALVAKVEDGNIFWLDGYIFTDCHSSSPLVELDSSVPDVQDFEPDIAAKLKGRHILSVSTAKFFTADLFTQEWIVAELIKAVVYDVKRGII